LADNASKLAFINLAFGITGTVFVNEIEQAKSSHAYNEHAVNFVEET
jgi:hypothetical protein